MKYFVISDVHNHYTEMMAALNKAGFDAENKEHKLILAGDAFDRGNEAYEVLVFLKEMLSKDKLIFIIGNHDYFVLNRFKENSFNTRKSGTFQTFQQVAEAYSKKKDLSDEEILKFSREAGLEDLIENKTVGFFETQKYIIAHGFIPNKKGVILPDWRNADLKSWFNAAGFNGMKTVMADGIKIPDKILICGHAGAAYGNVRAKTHPSEWARKDLGFEKLMVVKKDFSNKDIYRPFYGDGVIGIDGNCYKTGFINCIVIENEEIIG